jgi:glucose-6-phosphate 1-dehydrogenase
VTLDRELAREGVTAPTPYEVVLLAALRGDGRRFGNQDGIEQRWRIVQPLLSTPPPVHRYQPGTWGPAAAEALLGPHSPWQEPWLDPPLEVAHDRP